MSHTRNSPAQADPPQPTRRPFDAVMISLSAALLVLFGIVIGRVVVTTRTAEVVDHFDGELSSLRAELIDLNRQLVQSQSRVAALEETAEGLRQLANTQQIRADRLALQQQTLRAMLSSVVGQRDACLGEIQQYVALDQPVPAGDVLRFAAAMFDAPSQVLDQLTNDSTAATATTTPRLPGFPMTSSAASRSIPQTTVAQPVPALVQTAAAAPNSTGVFFAPPAKKREPGSYLYYPPRPTDDLTTIPRRSGITFLDQVANDEATTRR